MRTAFFFIISLFVLSFLSCTKEEISDPNYPSVVNAVGSSEIDQLFATLWETPLYECTLLDTFGFCHIGLTNEGCGEYDSVYIDYTKAQIASLFYEAIKTYSDFLHITDTLEIEIASIKNLKGVAFDTFQESFPDSATTGWFVTSNLQTLNGYAIPGTEIKVLILFDQVRSISGRRYSELYIPESDIYDEAKAKNSILNQELSYSSTTLKITEDTYWQESSKVILPIITDNKIELRICWKLRPENWVVLIDTQSGRELMTINMSKI